MLAAWHQIPRIKAEAQLAALEVQAARHMKPHDHRTFINRLVDQARGVVAEVAGDVERVFWDGAMMKSARQLKGKVVGAFGRGAAA